MAQNPMHLSVELDVPATDTLPDGPETSRGRMRRRRAGTFGAAALVMAMVLLAVDLATIAPRLGDKSEAHDLDLFLDEPDGASARLEAEFALDIDGRVPSRHGLTLDELNCELAIAQLEPSGDDDAAAGTLTERAGSRRPLFVAKLAPSSAAAPITLRRGANLESATASFSGFDFATLGRTAKDARAGRAMRVEVVCEWTATLSVLHMVDIQRTGKKVSSVVVGGPADDDEPASADARISAMLDGAGAKHVFGPRPWGCVAVPALWNDTAAALGAAESAVRAALGLLTNETISTENVLDDRAAVALTALTGVGGGAPADASFVHSIDAMRAAVLAHVREFALAFAPASLRLHHRRQSGGAAADANATPTSGDASGASAERLAATARWAEASRAQLAALLGGRVPLVVGSHCTPDDALINVAVDALGGHGVAVRLAARAAFLNATLPSSLRSFKVHAPVLEYDLGHAAATRHAEWLRNSATSHRVHDADDDAAAPSKALAGAALATRVEPAVLQLVGVEQLGEWRVGVACRADAGRARRNGNDGGGARQEAEAFAAEEDELDSEACALGLAQPFVTLAQQVSDCL